MYIADNTIRHKLNNVYFIIGSSCAGKTTASNELCKKYGMYHYNSDEMRGMHFANAQIEYQPCMKRPDADNLTAEEAREWEGDIVREFTPMIIADLIALSAQYPYVIYDGDIDTKQIFQVIRHNHIFCLLVNHKISKLEFFNRPDHIHMISDIQNRPDISRVEKEIEIIRIKTIAGVTEITPEDEIVEIPDEILNNNIKFYIRTENSTIPQMMSEIEKHFMLE